LSLQDEWYAKLEESGFRDIEDARGNLKQYDRRTIAFDNRDGILSFFRQLDHFLTAHPDVPDQERQILELYSEGKYRTQICQILRLDDWSVLKVIRKYRKQLI
jgi:DNA-binding CsgD family transcriptional regulator